MTAPRIDPEIEFHRFFTSGLLTQKQYEKHPGKLDLDKIDPNFARHLATIKRLINDKLAENASTIENHVGSVSLHLDYIAKPLPPIIRFANAVSFKFRGYFYVGVTIDLAELMNSICGRLAREPRTSSFLGIQAESADLRDRLLATLFLVQIQFAIDHELGHHFHGHTANGDETEFFSEYLDDDDTDSSDKLHDQAREVEADGYAIHMMAKNLFDSSGRGLLQVLGSSALDRDEFVVRFLLLCILSYLSLRPQRPFMPEDVRKERHPFGAMRAKVVRRDLEGWASEFKPIVGCLITDQLLDEINQIISVAACDDKALENVAQERAFSLTDEFLVYSSDLYKERDLLRSRMAENAWHLREESGDDRENQSQPGSNQLSP